MAGWNISQVDRIHVEMIPRREGTGPLNDRHLFTFNELLMILEAVLKNLPTGKDYDFRHKTCHIEYISVVVVARFWRWTFR